MGTMQIAHLEVFLAVAEEGSFAAAAKRLFIAPSRVTERVQQLERELHCTLIDRSNRSWELTQAGLALIPRAQGVLREVEAIRTLFPGDTEPDVKVGMRTLPRVFSDRVRSIMTTAAGDRDVTILPLDTEAQLHLLQTGRLDCGFVWAPPPESLDFLPVLTEELFAVLPATESYTSLDVVRPADLAGLKLASTVDPLTVPAALAPFLQYLPHVDIVNAAVEGALSLLVSSGRYCALQPRGLILGETEPAELRADVVVRPLMPPAPSLTTYFVWRPELEQTPPYAAVIRSVTHAFRTAEQR
ncbi:LysR family transcriptional regulator [Streptomyces shenzhenensis]|uniref:LysR family transcriptional regulator n=1 Tax=Streptomyces shenzhenensis TaxID=943815 RepID=UPI0033C110E9